mgnify:CR=1 FL=1
MKNKKNDSNKYDEVDNRFVKAINKIDDAIGDQRVDGGKRVDEYVRAKGGIQYGEQTIESIAQHPDIQVRAETLRRWWAYYRLHGQMGEKILSIYPKARARDFYELARILDAVILTRPGESREDAPKRAILELAEWLANKRNKGCYSCNDFAAMVTETLDASDATSVIERSDGVAQNKKNLKRSKVAKAISFAEIKDAVDYVVNFSDPRHLESGNINNTALCLEFNRLGDSLVLLADHLARAGHEAEVRDKIKSIRQNLNEIEAKLEPASVTWAGDSDTSVNIRGANED